MTNIIHNSGFISFKPHPLVRSGHLQTIVGYYLPGPKYTEPSRSHQIQLPDGDSLILCEHRGLSTTSAKKAILFMHGLGGDAAAPYMRRLAKLFADLGWVVFCMNHRGCGAGKGLARNIYHSGRSEDVNQVLTAIDKLFPDIPLIAVGFSLSGNMLLKLLGEGDRIGAPNLTGAIAVCPPIELSWCATALSRKQNRIYDIRFVRMLKAAIKERRTRFVDFPEFTFPVSLTLRQFDELCTAPLNRFQSAEDYYTKCSARQFLSGITLPTLILASDDDPFVPRETFDHLPENGFLKLIMTRSGGHMGFVAANKTPLGNHRWMDYALLECAESFIRHNHKSLNGFPCGGTVISSH